MVLARRKIDGKEFVMKFFGAHSTICIYFTIFYFSSPASAYSLSDGTGLADQVTLKKSLTTIGFFEKLEI